MTKDLIPSRDNEAENLEVAQRVNAILKARNVNAKDVPPDQMRTLITQERAKLRAELQVPAPVSDPVPAAARKVTPPAPTTPRKVQKPAPVVPQTAPEIIRGRRWFLGTALAAAGAAIVGPRWFWGSDDERDETPKKTEVAGEEPTTETETESTFSLSIHDKDADGKEVPKDKECIYGVLVPRIPLERKRSLFKTYDAQIEIAELSEEEKTAKETELQTLKDDPTRKGKRYIYDKGCTENIIELRESWQQLMEEPMVSFQVPGHPHRIMLRQEIAVRFLAGIDDYKYEKDEEGNPQRTLPQTTPLSEEVDRENGDNKRPYLRTNTDQREDWEAYQAGEGPVAASTYGGCHLRGTAADMGYNWRKYQPYFKRYGWIGGTENGIADDEHHFDIGRRLKPATAEETKDFATKFKAWKNSPKVKAAKKKLKELGGAAKKKAKKLGRSIKKWWNK